MTRVITLGEMLVDFVSTAPGTLAEAPAFVPAAGGAPANVAVGVARLGVASSFLGKVGNDPWGTFLAHTLQQHGVDTSGLRFTTEARTTLAFVSLQPDGERDFVFYRHPGADMLYAPADVDEQLIAEAAIVHCGSISLSAEPVRSATLHAVELAHKHGILCSYDPNLRLPLWKDEKFARTAILELWHLANIIKVSEEELFFLSGYNDIAEAARHLWHDNLRLLAITRGAAGSACFTAPTNYVSVPGYAVQAVDTTGAGDGWMAALLVQTILQPTLWQEPRDLQAALRFANAAGALTTTQRGAIPALPTSEQIQARINNDI
jgi:fructokinase